MVAFACPAVRRGWEPAVPPARRSWEPVHPAGRGGWMPLPPAFAHRPRQRHPAARVLFLAIGASACRGVPVRIGVPATMFLSGGSPREGARSELASGAATGGGGAQPPPTRTSSQHTTSWAPRPGRVRNTQPHGLPRPGRVRHTQPHGLPRPGRVRNTQPHGVPRPARHQGKRPIPLRRCHACRSRRSAGRCG